MIFKQKLKRIATWVASITFSFPAVNKYNDFLLSTWARPQIRRWYDKILFPIIFSYWIELIYLKESDPDERERLTIKDHGKIGKSGMGKSVS